MQKPDQAIIYTSRMKADVTDTQILHIVECAQKRNKTLGVTGLLVAANGYFIQYFEGALENVEEVYAIIKAHALHHDLQELMNEPISQRAFSDWSMAYAKTQIKSFVELTATLRSMSQNQYRRDATPQSMILHQFWKQIKPK